MPLLDATNEAAETNGCLLRCKDNYMLEMQSLFADGTHGRGFNLVTPLQSLFTAGGRMDVYSRLQLACNAHDVFMRCLQTCRQSKARSIVELGQSSWTTICDALADDRTFQSAILPCWVRHGEFISAECDFYARMLQNAAIDLMQNGWTGSTENLDEVCRSITLYDKCYLSNSDHVCGTKGWQFLLDLNTKNSQGLIKLLTENAAGPIPTACKAIVQPQEYARWHSDNIRGLRSATHRMKAISFVHLLISVFLSFH
ncbi:hypothetical protein M3Y99_00059500 [Aphelenchoides fujianensis]|nr:hypothetical protein M3Y99_00059500 [Aphelenchoides fujianensis]